MDKDYPDAREQRVIPRDYPPVTAQSIAAAKMAQMVERLANGLDPITGRPFEWDRPAS